MQRTIRRLSTLRFARRPAGIVPWLVAAAAVMVLVPAVLATSPTVGIVNFAFDPVSVTVTAGEAVTWQNRGTVQHTVTADDGSFASGPLDPGNQFANVFDQAGTFTYHCSIHASMHGTVIVVAAPVTPTPATFEPTPPAGTLPPGFSPRPILTEGPTGAPSAVPTPQPSVAAAGGGTSGPGSVLFGVAVVAVAGLIGLLAWARRPRRPRR